MKNYGEQKIILGADVKEEKIAVGGWLETSTLDLIPFINSYKQKGISKVICTDISKDGMLLGPALELYRKIMSEFNDLYLIASGGVSSIKDIELLNEAGIPAVITGKAIYEGRIQLSDLKKFIV